MGTSVTQRVFSQEDHKAFQEKLHQQLDELKDIIDCPVFGKEPLKLGAELEMYLTDPQGNVSFSNQALLSKLKDDQFQPELNQYNLELNLSAFALNQQPLNQLHDEISTKLHHLNHTAGKLNISPVAIGILPTLEKCHLNMQYMTDVPRYHNLAHFLYQERGQAFEVNINGEEQLTMSFDDICAEGANTSFQVHLMIPPERFAKVFNAAQLSSPLVTAIGANSPIFMGKKLWHETRVALFKQALDIRLRNKVKWQEPTRVNFGFGWVRENPWELFAEAVALYPTVMPFISNEQNNAAISAASGNADTKALPPLNELSLHMGTLWPWHRPVYCNQGNGHIRIEFRAIPAGPSVIDMVANTAFAIGLANGLADDIDRLICQVPFRFAEYNFYRAAQQGLFAKILWPLKHKYRANEVAIADVIEHMLPIAEQGLIDLGISEQEAKHYLAVIANRLSSKQNGAVWQKNTLNKLLTEYEKPEALQQLVKSYLTNSQANIPVANWE